MRILSNDPEELTDLNAAPWMLEALKLNPSYVFWGPYEDYMCSKDAGWAAPGFLGGWDEHWKLNELNELVNFYFEVERSSVTCEACDGEGVNPATLRISQDFYDFLGAGARWVHNITQDEVEALWEAGRLTHDFKEQPTAAQVNAWSHRGMGHDAINRWILIKQRAKREGVYGECSVCQGRGRVFTEEAAHVNLVLWFILPRKGASRGVEIKGIQESDLPDIRAYLREAAERNADRFRLA